MILQALLISIITWLICGFEAWLAYPMINTPLVLCPIVGFICGDLNTGIVCGATLQLIFLGVMGIGGTLPADSALGSIIGTALAIWMGADTETALAFAVPVSIIGSTFTFLGYLIRTLFTPLTAKLVEQGNQKALELEHIALAFLPELPKYIVVFVVLAFGNTLAEQLISITPQTLIDGMDYASNLMPAIGIALLLKMMWNKNIAVYFFLGAILATFFGQSTLSVAMLGTVLAIILLSLEKKNAGPTNNGTFDDGGLFND